MKIYNRIALLFLVLIAVNATFHSSAFADRFYVALILPLSGPESASGRQIREGFMLATTERDSHPEEESDGHLGNLDSYVSVIDANGNVADDIKRLSSESRINIVAAFTSAKTQSQISRLLKGTNIALLLPGETPFADNKSPAVANFISSYQRAYGARPSSMAAQGYNAARRLDTAVRAQGGIADLTPLKQSFHQTARNFAW